MVCNVHGCFGCASGLSTFHPPTPCKADGRLRDWISYGIASVRTTVWVAVFVKGNVIVTACCNFKELQMTMFLSIQS